MSKFTDTEIETAIVERAARGDAKAHEIIYRACATPAHSLCLRITRVPAHAEDLLQETFIEIMRCIGGFRGEAALGSSVRRIAVNKALMFLRSAWHGKGQSFHEHWQNETPGRADRHGVSSYPVEAIDLDSALGRRAPLLPCARHVFVRFRL